MRLCASLASLVGLAKETRRQMHWRPNANERPGCDAFQPSGRQYSRQVRLHGWSCSLHFILLLCFPGPSHFVDLQVIHPQSLFSMYKLMNRLSNLFAALRNRESLLPDFDYDAQDKREQDLQIIIYKKPGSAPEVEKPSVSASRKLRVFPRRLHVQSRALRFGKCSRQL